MNKRLAQIERRIEKIKEELTEVGEMRPGSLTRQYKDPESQSGPYYQLRGSCAALKALAAAGSGRYPKNFTPENRSKSAFRARNHSPFALFTPAAGGNS
jgi:hypothetical protein